MFWPTHLERDPGHLWFREVMKTAAARLDRTSRAIDGEGVKPWFL